MNIKEALEWSKANGGRSVSRANPHWGAYGWIAWCNDAGRLGEAFVYELAFEDLTADDWEPDAAGPSGRHQEIP